MSHRKTIQPVLLLLVGVLLTGCPLGQSEAPQRGGGPDPATPPGQPAQPFTFIFAGDPQIGGVRGGAGQRFERLARKIAPFAPAFVLVAGDLVDEGEDAEQWAEFDRARRAFAAVPMLAVPGNHDGPAGFRARFPNVPFNFAHGNCQFIGIDSNLICSRAKGRQEEADAQWRWLDAALRHARAAGRVHIFLVMHHPPGLLTRSAGDRLSDLTRRYGIGTILCGHIHVSVEGQRGGATVYTTAGTGWAADGSLGFRVFTVRGGQVEQRYVRLED